VAICCFLVLGSFTFGIESGVMNGTIVKPSFIQDWCATGKGKAGSLNALAVRIKHEPVFSALSSNADESGTEEFEGAAPGGTLSSTSSALTLRQRPLPPLKSTLSLPSPTSPPVSPLSLPAPELAAHAASGLDLGVVTGTPFSSRSSSIDGGEGDERVTDTPPSLNSCFAPNLGEQPRAFVRFKSLATSMLILGSFVGSMLLGPLLNSKAGGRIRAMFSGAIVSLAAVVWTVFTPAGLEPLFLAARALDGIGLGIVTFTLPLYISEVIFLCVRACACDAVVF
jgi:hypothetical protein